MATETLWIEVGGMLVEIHRKAIKNLYIGVYPPHGRVRVAAPRRLGEEAIRLAVISRRRWIRRQQQRFADQARQSVREMVTGESHYFQGRRYRLNVVEQAGRPRVRVTANATLALHVPPGTARAARSQVLERWYRQQLSGWLPGLLREWQPILGVQVAACRIKRMKTRWGSCNPAARRIWLNLELAKKPAACLEYVLVHEMVHLLEQRHTDRFHRLMDRFLPDWRLRRDVLNRSPLTPEDWPD